MAQISRVLSTFFKQHLDWRLFAVRLVFLSLLYGAMKLGVEYLFLEKFLGVPEQDVSVVARCYRFITTTMGRGLRAQYCTIVRVESPATPVLQLDDCAIRGKLAEVFRAVLSYEPRAVVAVYTLRKLECCQQTDILLKVVQDACAARRRSPVPIIFGYNLAPGPKVLAHMSITPSEPGNNCAMGVTNAELDVRVVPLQFKVDGYAAPSLAWSVVQMTGDDSLKKDLTPFADGESPLYAGLLSSNDFGQNTLTEEALLSGKFDSKMLRGRIVVVGSADDEVIPTVFGPLQSHVLHAGYIEALLDRRTLREIPWPISFMVALLFWYPIEQSRQFPKNLKVFGFATAGLFVASVLLVTTVGRYGDFSTISVAGFLLWLFTATKETPWVQKWMEKHLHFLAPSNQ